MELGNAVLKRSSVNLLYRALHPRHGLAWTDGKNIFLSPINITNDTLKQCSPLRLGEYDAILGLCWSCDFPGPWCYLCVIQYQKVSIWRVEGSVPDIKLKLVRKISKTLVPQGCVWNPMRDILAILTPEQCNLYYRHSDKKSSLALPTPVGSGNLKCVTWSDAGDKLYLATRTTVWTFSWPNIDAKLKEFSSVESLLDISSGNIVTMVAVGQDFLLVAKELPLDKLCTQSDLAAGLDMDAVAKSPTDAIMNLSAGQSKPEEHATLVLLSVRSDGMVKISNQSLPGLLCPDLLSYSLEESLQVVVVGSNTQSSLHFYSISGIGSFIKEHDIVLPDSDRPKGLCKSNIAKSVFVLIGKPQKSHDAAFLSASSDVEYSLRLNLTKLFPSGGPSKSAAEPLVPTEKPVIEVMDSNDNEDKLASKESAIVDLSPSGTLPKINNSDRANNKVSTNDVDWLNRQLSSSQPHLSSQQQAGQPGMARGSNNDLGGQLGAKTQFTANKLSSSVSLEEKGTSSSLTSQNSDARPEINGTSSSKSDQIVNRSTLWRNITHSDDSSISNQTDNDTDLGHSDLGHTSRYPDEESFNFLNESLQRHEDMINGLRIRVEKLSQMLEECHMISVNSYQDLQSPETARVRFTSSRNGTHEINFLLDRGRLKLDTLKETFHVPCLTLEADGVPIVLTSNIDGYIPLKFLPGETYCVSCPFAPEEDEKVRSEKSRPADTKSRPADTKSRPADTKSNDVVENRQSATKDESLSKNDKTEFIKAMILNDKSGNAMRRLQAMTSTNRARLSKGSSPDCDEDSQAGSEPVKPPRKSNNRMNKPGPGGSPDDASTSSYVDVTVAL